MIERIIDNKINDLEKQLEEKDDTEMIPIDMMSIEITLTAKTEEKGMAIANNQLKNRNDWRLRWTSFDPHDGQFSAYFERERAYD